MRTLSGSRTACAGTVLGALAARANVRSSCASAEAGAPSQVVIMRKIESRSMSAPLLVAHVSLARVSAWTPVAGNPSPGVRRGKAPDGGTADRAIFGDECLRLTLLQHLLDGVTSLGAARDLGSILKGFGIVRTGASGDEDRPGELQPGAHRPSVKCSCSGYGR